ncbi:MAG TPA: chemotaxis protein CheA [Bacillota bacterium]|nr:chemotaxis protein CheA [Clostridiaceae bacterium]HNR03979.1 chemotaxis protein CheA [Bacillota bacterium]HPA55456.1 chemotaxis protein CheA [Bacillota bacterium]HPX68757.1 chemotaxis protein CheA [Bacillota bacterium]HQA65115.1 chemotaxis protein CheA [Bacillota bacterium]
MDVNQYMEIFIEESLEHLQELNQNLLSLETNPGDMKTLNEIFRVAHTLKGMAGTMGFTGIANLTHQMENVLDAIRTGNIEVNSSMIDILFECLDYLSNSINTISATGKESSSNVNSIIAGLNGMLAKKPEAEASDTADKKEPQESKMKFNQYDDNIIRKAVQQNHGVYKITVVLAKDCMLKSARAFLVFQTVERYAEIFKSEPKVEDIEDEKFDNEFTIAIITKETEALIRKELESISEVTEVIFERIEVPEELDVKDIDEITNEEKETLKYSIEDKENGDYIQGKKARMGKTVRVDIDRLDKLMNLVSELIIIKTRLEGVGTDSKNQDMIEAVEYLERITTNLHDAVMKVRMVPIERVFNRFPRMVRDLAKSLSKDIILNMSGEDTELDRTVIDEIGDPLIHLIRNSIDHGIEEKEERIKNNKPANGTVNLRAYQDGNSVVIEVEDDGAGIDIEKIKRKAVERGILTSSEADDLDEKSAIELLFNPGFSTADKVSGLSGRGVGLDVVKTKIESLNGLVEVENYRGKGSKFIIRLPLTLAIIQALLVNIGEEKFAIPLNVIRDIIDIEASTIRNVHGQDVVLNRGNVLPIVRIAKMLGVINASSDDSDQLTAVVVKKGEKNAAFIVDSLMGQQEIVIKTLGKFLSGIRNIAGATILGDGQVALIIDSNSLI